MSSGNGLFEADYLAAFSISAAMQINLFDKHELDDFIDMNVFVAHKIWLQQRKRHEAEVAELVACVKSLAICNDDGATKSGFDSKLEMAHAMIAKFESGT